MQSNSRKHPGCYPLPWRPLAEPIWNRSDSSIQGCSSRIELSTSSDERRGNRSNKLEEDNTTICSGVTKSMIWRPILPTTSVHSQNQYQHNTPLTTVTTTQPPNHRSSGNRRPIRSLGPESCCSGRSGYRNCRTNRPRREDVECAGHETGVEGALGALQDPG